MDKWLVRQSLIGLISSSERRSLSTETTETVTANICEESDTASSIVTTQNTESIETRTVDTRAGSDTDDIDDNPKLPKIRRYDVNYLSFGFSWCGEEKQPKPQCV